MVSMVGKHTVGGAPWTSACPLRMEERLLRIEKIILNSVSVPDVWGMDFGSSKRDQESKQKIHREPQLSCCVSQRRIYTWIYMCVYTSVCGSNCWARDNRRAKSGCVGVEMPIDPRLGVLPWNPELKRRSWGTFRVYYWWSCRASFIPNDHF